MVWATRILGAARRAAPLASFTLAGGAAVMACDPSTSSSSSSASAPSAAAGSGKNPRVWVHDALEGEGMLARKALGVDPDLLKTRLERMVLFSGSSNPPLAEEVAYELHKPLGKMSVNRFSDGETHIQALESVRGKDVYVIQSTSQPVNENLIELCLMVSALRRASARTITAIIPYYGYKRDVGTVSTLTHLIRHGIVVRQEQQQQQQQQLEQLEQQQQKLLKDQPQDMEEDGRLHGGLDGEAGAGGSGGAATTAEAAGYSGAFPISAADVARMLETVGVDRILSVELQPPGMGQIEVRERERGSEREGGREETSNPPIAIRPHTLTKNTRFPPFPPRRASSPPTSPSSPSARRALRSTSCPASSSRAPSSSRPTSPASSSRTISAPACRRRRAAPSASRPSCRPAPPAGATGTPTR
jgi:hypothetical protein